MDSVNVKHCGGNPIHVHLEGTNNEQMMHVLSLSLVTYITQHVRCPMITFDVDANEHRVLIHLFQLPS